MIKEGNKAAGGTPVNLDEGQAGEREISMRPGWREAFRQAFDKARREQQPASRRELGRDRTRSFFLLAGAAIAVLLLLLGVFSSSNTKKATSARPLGTPDLGRRMIRGQQHSGQPGSITPLLNAQTSPADVAPEREVTPEEIGRTARPVQPLVRSTHIPVTNPGSAGPYSLARINFSDIAQREQRTQSSKTTGEPTSDDLRKASLVFVRNMQTNAAASALRHAPAPADERPRTLNLPAGTRLMARLQAVVSSAVKTPVVAAIEYSYERDGEILVPAGARVIGSLQQADRSGYIGIRFDTIQMPDGSREKVDATAMSLNFGPLRGVVSGRRTGTNFLIRAFSGIGQAASYAIGANGLNAQLSQGALVRDQIATNIGIAGDQQLNSLAFNQNIVVSVPGNTRFYVVIEKGSTANEEQAQHAQAPPAMNESLPTAEELRQLLQLRQELSALYRQPIVENSAQ
ncbi:MAG: hypothetical protein ACRD8A_00150 [Candidatus Acidiferrales bacterium]